MKVEHGKKTADIAKNLKVPKKCHNKFDCLELEMLSIKDPKPKLNKQCDLIWAKLFLAILAHRLFSPVIFYLEKEILANIRQQVTPTPSLIADCFCYVLFKEKFIASNAFYVIARRVIFFLQV